MRKKRTLTVDEVYRRCDKFTIEELTAPYKAKSTAWVSICKALDITCSLNNRKRISKLCRSKEGILYSLRRGIGKRERQRPTRFKSSEYTFPKTLKNASYFKRNTKGTTRTSESPLHSERLYSDDSPPINTVEMEGQRNGSDGIGSSDVGSMSDIQSVLTEEISSEIKPLHKTETDDVSDLERQSEEQQSCSDDDSSFNESDNHSQECHAREELDVHIDIPIVSPSTEERSSDLETAFPESNPVGMQGTYDGDRTTSSETSCHFHKYEDERSMEAKKEKSPEQEEDIIKIECPKKSKLVLTHEEWIKLKPTRKSSARDFRLRAGWTETFARKFAETNPACVLVFTYNKVVNKDSRKSGSCRYFTGKAKCKFRRCCQYTFSIAQCPPEACDKVIVRVIRHGKAQHCTRMTHKRHLKGKKRKKVAKRAKRTGVSNTFYGKLGQIDESAFTAGNMTECASKDVIKQAVYEKSKEESMAKDELIDIMRTKDLLQETDYDSDKIKGYLHDISLDPFAVICFTETQIKIIKEQSSCNNFVLYLDATGSVVKKTFSQDKKPFYYAAVIRNPVAGEPPLPVAEMVTTDHTTVKIVTFLNKFRHSSNVVTGMPIEPNRVEVDFSWPFINANLLVYNQENIAKYLQRIWILLNTQRPLPKFTVVHICAAHMIKTFANRIAKIANPSLSTEMKRFLLYCFGLLQNSKTLQEAGDLYRDISNILLTRRIDNNSEMALKSINRRVALLPEKPELDSALSDQVGEEVDDMPPLDEKGKRSTIREISPFTLYFEKFVCKDEDSDTVPCTNAYFSTEAHDAFVKYMPLFPLWSGCLLEGDLTRDTNNTVENWFKIVKENIFQRRRRVRTAEFFRTIMKTLRGRFRAFQQSVSTSKPDKKREGYSDIELKEEKWSGKKRTKQSRYFNRPTTIPSPKLKRLKVKKQTKIKDKKKHDKNDTKKPQVQIEVVDDTDDIPRNGLINKGSTCWLNSTLQAFKGFDQFTQRNSDTSQDDLHAVQNMLNVLRQKTGIMTFKHSADDILESLKTMDEFKHINVRAQQDPCPLIHSLLHRFAAKQMFQPMSLHYDRTCARCGQMRSSDDQLLTTLPVELPSVKNPSLQDCIDECFKEQVLSEDNEVYCEGCLEPSPHVELPVVVVAPSALIIQIKRFDFSLHKLNVAIHINRSVTIPGISWKFSLKSVQIHHGTLVTSGHYTTLTVDRHTAVMFDDTLISRKKDSFIDTEFVKRNAYVVYFERNDRNSVDDDGGYTTQEDTVGKQHDHHLMTVGGIELRAEDIHTLDKQNWINDQIINAYLGKITSECSHKQCQAIDSFGLSKDDNIFRGSNGTEDLILIPVHVTAHWLLAAIFPRKKRFVVLDPAGFTNTKVVKQIREMYADIKGVTLRRDRHLEMTATLQDNSYDCGLFVMLYGKCLVNDSPLSFDKTMMTRKTILEELKVEAKSNANR